MGGKTPLTLIVIAFDTHPYRCFTLIAWHFFKPSYRVQSRRCSHQTARAREKHGKSHGHGGLVSMDWEPHLSLSKNPRKMWEHIIHSSSITMWKHGIWTRFSDGGQVARIMAHFGRRCWGPFPFSQDPQKASGHVPVITAYFFGNIHSINGVWMVWSTYDW